MKLKCEECGSRNNSFNESLGETVCDDCGLVLDVEIFEQTTLGIKNGEVISLANKIEEGNYFSFPIKEHLLKFRQKGYKLL